MTIPVETSSTSPNFDDLLFYFQRCDAYADRLAFWEQYQLTDRLYYHNESDERAAVELLNKRWQCQSWEEIKQLPILTLMPFTYEEAQQFVDWALRVRPGMKPIISYELKERSVIERYLAIPSGSDKQFFLTTYTQQIERQKNADFSLMGGNHLAEYSLKIDVSVYIEIITVLRIAADFPIAHRIWQAENVEKNRVMDWQLIDTYLYAQTILKTSRFLENFDPASLEPEPAENTTEKQREYEPPFILILVQEQIFKTLVPYIDTDQHKAFKSVLNGEKIACRVWIKTQKSVMVDVFKRTVENVSDVQLAYWLSCHFAYGKRKPEAVSFDYAKDVIRDKVIVSRNKQLVLR